MQSPDTSDIMVIDELLLEIKHTEIAFIKLKNRKTPGLNDIINGLLKYRGEKLTQQLKVRIKYYFFVKFQTNVRVSTITLLFNKGYQKLQVHSKGLHLLSVTLKFNSNK